MVDLSCNYYYKTIKTTHLNGYFFLNTVFIKSNPNNAPAELAKTSNISAVRVIVNTP